jgi:hypothetical protein
MGLAVAIGLGDGLVGLLAIASVLASRVRLFIPHTKDVLTCLQHGVITSE